MGDLALRRSIFAGLISGVSAGFCLPTHATPTHCEISSTPVSPTASAEAFSQRDVEFSATMHVQCFDAAKSPVAASPVCVSARREHISESVDMVRSGRVIPYEVTMNGVPIVGNEQKVWGGSVSASGTDLITDYRIRANDFVGFPAGAYQAVTNWKVHLHMESCP